MALVPAVFVVMAHQYDDHNRIEEHHHDHSSEQKKKHLLVFLDRNSLFRHMMQLVITVVKKEFTGNSLI